MEKTALLGLEPDELTNIALECGLPKFAGKQMAIWLYKKHVTYIDQMTDISKAGRDRLKEKYEIGCSEPTKVQESVDGTKKYLFTVGTNKFIEAAYIPDDDRATLCVSSQVGCKMGCLFCMTGKQGFQSQLTAGQIINQIRSLPERDKLTNIVYMGMGEPFDNLEQLLKSLRILCADWGFGMSPRRITVSSIGIIPGIKKFLEESEAHLAISLHSPFETERKKLMPIENVYPLPEMLKVIKQFDFGKQRRVSFEYIMFKGLNDKFIHVRELAKVLNGIDCRINLIRFHPIPDTPLEGSDDATIAEFQSNLKAKGIMTTLRASRGQDIFAACGLLSTKELVKIIPTDF
ncbi:MAG TPA: 23S rRNA (adenine(2503)-C(2))-methyltransferase RlmN [Bacteroidales bacterium]|nr:23S rRNA (adenine(2503)-C(2))-methyltransferase RlmN [Bacteroidales bacterium]